jgi:hypothetical protein
LEVFQYYDTASLGQHLDPYVVEFLVDVELVVDLMVLACLESLGDELGLQVACLVLHVLLGLVVEVLV